MGDFNSVALGRYPQPQQGHFAAYAAIFGDGSVAPLGATTCGGWKERLRGFRVCGRGSYMHCAEFASLFSARVSHSTFFFG